MIENIQQGGRRCHMPLPSSFDHLQFKRLMFDERIHLMIFIDEVNMARFIPVNWISYQSNEDVRSFLAEFVGTAILVIFTCGACTSTASKSDSLVATALSFGLTVACLVASIGHVSGCHINPAVTVGLFVNGQLSLFKAIWYIMAQLLGAVAGAGILNASLVNKGNLCSTTLSVSPGQGLVIEAFICFLLIFVICNVCESNSANAPVLIGLAVTAGHLFAIPLTSSSMNTARSFGPAVVSGVWSNHWVYWFGPLIGGALGGFFHRYVFVNKTLDPNMESTASVQINDENLKNTATLKTITSI